MKEYTINQLFKTRWEELTPKEIIAVIAISEQLLKHEPDTTEYGLQVISMLRVLRKNHAAVSHINVDQAVDCFNDITFFKRHTNGEFINPWLFFPVGNFKSNNVQFFRPEINGDLPMYNCIFDQLVFADASFSAFCVLNYEYNQLDQSTHQAKQLQRDIDETVNALIAILYTHPSVFDAANIEVNARLVPLTLTLAQRSLILHTYANVRNFITNRCPNLFKKTETTQPAAPTLTGEVWLNLRYDLAETKQFQGFDTARNARIYDALDLMEKKALENINQKQPHVQG